MGKSVPATWLLPLSIVAALAVLSGGALLYQAQVRSLRRTAEAELRVVGELKASEVSAWWGHQESEARELMSSPFLIREVDRWLADATAGDEEAILQRLNALRGNHHHDYANVLLLDGNGTIAISLEPDVEALDPPVAAAASTAYAEGEPALIDLYLDADDQPRLGVVAPLLRREGGQERRVGAIVLLSDPYLHLYTIVSSLHLAGESVESLLVRREGDAAVYLSPLRHRPDAPLSVGVPLTEGRVTAVMAVSGQTGVVEGVDYRGVRVISALQPVRNLDWFVVTEIDIEEALAARRRDGVAIAGVSALVLLLIGALTMLAWQANRRSLLETRLAEAALGESEARHGATLRSVGDGVIATDTAARVTLMNPTAEMLTGWTQAEAMGRPLTEVFGIVNELTGERAENPADRVIREGVVLGLANHTLLISRDGTRRPVADSGAPIFDAQGTILGMVLVFRDQTEERAAQRALEAREAQYRALVESTDAVAWEYAIADDRWTYIAPQVTRLLGYPPEEWQGFAFWTDHLHPDDRDWVTHYIQHCTARGKAYTLECRFRARDGRYVWLRDVASVEMEEEEPVARRGFLLDISEQRAAEESLRQSEERFRSLIQNAPVALFVEADAHIAYLNPAAARVWGAESVEELEGQPLLEHLDPRIHAAVRDRMQRLHEEGHAAPAMESVLLRMDGTPVAAEVAAVPVQYDGLDAALVFVQDISTRKEAEERLAEQMEELSRWHKATLGREMRIIELKQEVNELLARMGAPPRYET